MDKKMDKNNVVFLASHLQHIRAVQAIYLDKYQWLLMNINLFKIRNDENSLDTPDTLDTVDSVKKKKRIDILNMYK